MLAALTNALKVVKKTIGEIRITLNGAGAAGAAIARLLGRVGAEHLIVCDRQGPIYEGRSEHMNPVKQWIADNTNPDRVSGNLGDALQGADVFIGVSGADVLTVEHSKRMVSKPIVFALANPDPEIKPELALPHVEVMATGRSDYPNQINNVLCFPGFFRGLLDIRARQITDDMKVAAAYAIANVIADDEVLASYIIPSVFDRRVAKAVAEAVSKSATQTGVARREQKAVHHRLL